MQSKLLAIPQVNIHVAQMLFPSPTNSIKVQKLRNNIMHWH